MAAGEFRLDRVLPVLQPVHRRVDAARGYRGGAEVGAQGGVIPPGQGGQLGGRGDDPGDDQGQRQVAFGAGRAEQRGQPELDGHRVDGGDVPVRQRPQDRHRAGGGHQGGAFQRRLDRVDHGLWQPGQVRQRLVPHLAAVAVGAPQVPGLVVAPLSFLVGVAAADPGHVHRRRLSCHDPDDIGECRLVHPETKIFLATLYSPQATVYAGQDRNLYAELRQLRVRAYPAFKSISCSVLSGPARTVPSAWLPRLDHKGAGRQDEASDSDPLTLAEYVTHCPKISVR